MRRGGGHGDDDGGTDARRGRLSRRCRVKYGNNCYVYMSPFINGTNARAAHNQPWHLRVGKILLVTLIETFT